MIPKEVNRKIVRRANKAFGNISDDFHAMELRRQSISDMKAGARLALESTGWIDCKDRLPEAKEGWEHSAQCLVWYNGTADHYGISYYHYSPPFVDGGAWIDFARYGVQPQFWMPLPTSLPPTSKP